MFRQIDFSTKCIRIYKYTTNVRVASHKPTFTHMILATFSDLQILSRKSLCATNTVGPTDHDV